MPCGNAESQTETETFEAGSSPCRRVPNSKGIYHSTWTMDTATMTTTKSRQLKPTTRKIYQKMVIWLALCQERRVHDSASLTGKTPSEEPVPKLTRQFVILSKLATSRSSISPRKKSTRNHTRSCLPSLVSQATWMAPTRMIYTEMVRLVSLLATRMKWAQRIPIRVPQTLPQSMNRKKLVVSPPLRLQTKFKGARTTTSPRVFIPIHQTTRRQF
mmetsp:Transcript_9192/g.15303  ORF Transcript_9192/g.15303 Transcript_9192/m.15303 type:complete len:215 (+) Transcript_9192:248-892(+)